jgi:Tfp pilus assembly protein PilX
MTFRLNLTVKQSGMALPIVLVLLLVMTLIGVAVLRTTMSEERMAANDRQRQVAFNAAETTLRFAERHAMRLRDKVRVGELDYDGGSTRLFQNDSLEPQWPEGSTVHDGDKCTGGYCIPAQFHQSTIGPPPDGERWEDPLLNVWVNAARHHVYEDFDSAQLDLEGVLEAPKYIIEYMGDYPVEDAFGVLQNACDQTPPAGPGGSSTYNVLNNVWPYCSADPSLFRVTARAAVGRGGKDSVVILQSTILVPD